MFLWMDGGLTMLGWVGVIIAYAVFFYGYYRLIRWMDAHDSFFMAVGDTLKMVWLGFLGLALVGGVIWLFFRIV